jgi:hypothetical protein
MDIIISAEYHRIPMDSAGRPHRETQYCTISFKSTGGVTRDPFYLFDISAAADFLRDTSKISAFEPEILPFLPFFFLRQFGACVTAWRFDRGPSDV